MQLEIDKVLDICSGRHQGNAESRFANYRSLGNRASQRQMVLNLIRQTPRSMKQIAAICGVPFNTISGRGSELKKLGLVEETGIVVHGSMVLRAVETVVPTAEEVVDFLNKDDE
jgi:predicted transcriptional regulator